MLDGMEEFLAALESGEKIPVTEVTREETPDGPMHVRSMHAMTLEEIRAGHRNRIFYRKIGAKIKELRLAKGMTIQQLAVASGLEVHHIVRYEVGALATTDKGVGMLAKGLGVKKSDISETYSDEETCP